MRDTELITRLHRLCGNARPVILTLTVTLIAACSTVPEGLRGEYVDLAPQSAASADIGREIRWGGVILATTPSADRTCFEVLSRSLDRSARPRAEDRTRGRFIGCASGFHDPEVFKQGREITMTGRISRIEEGKVGEFDYRFPVVAADFVTMWPERPDIIVYDYYDPFYHPWYWWGPYYYPPYPYYYPPRHSRVYRGGSRERVEIRSPEK